MGRPQDNRLQRSGNTPLDPDHIETEVQTQPHAPRDEPGGGPIPVDQQPGHHPPVEQDKPDLEAFAERFGIPTDEEDGTSADADERPAESANGDHHGPIDLVRSVAATAWDKSEPVANLVQGSVARIAHLVEERWSLGQRVERLEEQVAELTQRLDEQSRSA